MGFIDEPARAQIKLMEWTRRTLRETGFSELMIGLSGGIDSALAAHLAAEAVGPESVTCLLMPSGSSSSDSITDAERVVHALGVKSRTIPLDGMVKAFEREISGLSDLRRGNLCARLRMAVLFDEAHGRGLVLGTSNKTETILGYSTVYGDSAWSLNPLGDLYKTDVRTLASHIGIAPSIISKAPSADLWEGQTDEGELGLSYDEIDRILVMIVDEKKSRNQALAAGIPPAALEKVLLQIRRTKFKRSQPPVCWIEEPYSLDHLYGSVWS